MYDPSPKVLDFEKSSKEYNDAHWYWVQVEFTVIVMSHPLLAITTVGILHGSG